MLDFKSIRPLDAAIVVVLVIVVGLGGFLGYSIWANSRQIEASTPASRAIDSLAAEVRKTPNNVDARMRLAQALAVAGRDNDAVAQYNAILKINKEYTPALSGLGFIALKQKDWETGEKYYRKIIDLREGAVDASKDSVLETAYYYLGSSLLERKHYEEAAQNFTKALTIRRDASDTHYALAVCFRGMGSEAKYREALETTLLFDPKMPEPNYDMAMLLLKDGDRAAAAEHLRISADAAPGVDKPTDELEKFGKAEDHLAKAKRLGKSDVKQALSEARIAAALDPRALDAWLIQARLWKQDGQNELSDGAIREVIKIDPDNAEANKALDGGAE